MAESLARVAGKAGVHIQLFDLCGGWWSRHAQKAYQQYRWSLRGLRVTQINMETQGKHEERETKRAALGAESEAERTLGSVNSMLVQFA